jgi:hypothetical protein
MSKINDVSLGAQTQQAPFHCAYKTVFCAKITEQANEGSHTEVAVEEVQIKLYFLEQRSMVTRISPEISIFSTNCRGGL